MSAMDAVTQVPVPVNEPVLSYAPGTPARAGLQAALGELAAHPFELTCSIGGKRVLGGGEQFDVVEPHARHHVLGHGATATHDDASAAIAAARAAAPAWRDLSFDDRAAIFLKAADLLAGPWRYRLNAATMLGQSKTAIQAEIDAACELIDFWRFNVTFARQILADQPISGAGRLEPRRPPPARGLRVRGHAVQLHRDRRQPADRARADGQHRRLEAGAQPAARGAPDQRPARGGRAAARRDQHGDRRRCRGVRGGARRPGPRRHPLHRLDQGLPAAVADRGGEHRLLPLLPADRRRDRWQGLRGRAPQRRPRRPAHRDGPGRVRVPGPEVLGRVARLRPAQPVVPAARRRRRRGPEPVDGRRSPTCRTSWVR